MCFVVTLKKDNLKIRRDNGKPMHMCLRKTKNNHWDEVPWEHKNDHSQDVIGFDNLEICDWKRKKCEECNRVYYAVIVLALLSNDSSLIRNLGEILEMIQRPSITNGREIRGILGNTRSELLINLASGFSYLKMLIEEFRDIGKYRSTNPCYPRRNGDMRISFTGHKCKFIKIHLTLFLLVQLLW